MKSYIVFALIIAVAVAGPIDSKLAEVLRFDFDNIGVNGFSYSYETNDGKSASEQGQLANVGTDNEVLQVRGQYSYTDDKGVVYTVTYTADENGFRPEGAHIPKA